ncbi:MAG: CoA ester lyase, partial [Alphaproteobacteria bacterium]|nr:CoA ester lyase [Alphaproteobacteria bacterium]
PKVESGAMVTEFEGLLRHGGVPSHTALWFMIETPLGVLHAEEIARASPRAACVVMGTNDLTKELRARHTPDRAPVAPALGLCILAARAYGLAILDGVHNELNDEAGFAAACRQGLALGMDGKTLIHPKQIEPCNQIFAPSPEELDGARRIVAAFAEAEKAGRGVVVVDGRLVENLHVENARRLMALGEAIAALGNT